MKKLLIKAIFIILFGNISIQKQIYPILNFIRNKNKNEKTKVALSSRASRNSKFYIISNDYGTRSIQKKPKKTDHISIIVSHIKTIIIQELKNSKIENKDILTEISGTIQSKLNIIINNILSRIKAITHNSDQLEYKVTYRLVVILEESLENLNRSNFAKILLSKINLFTTAGEISKDKTSKDKSYNLIEQTSELIAKSFSEIITETKSLLERINSRKNIINLKTEAIVDMLIEKFFQLTNNIVDNIIAPKLNELFESLLSESNSLIQTAAKPILNYKSMNIIKDYLEIAHSKVVENKKLIIEYAKPHIIEICSKN